MLEFWSMSGWVVRSKVIGAFHMLCVVF